MELSKVLVVITDGQQTVRGGITTATLKELAIELKKKGVVNIGVGIGGSPSQSELLNIAQGVPENVMKIDDFKLLNNRTDTLVQLACKPANECYLYQPCHDNATCIDTMDSYTCHCKLGFTGNGTSCYDINECLANPCKDGSSCMNTVGSFTCQCSQGETYNYQDTSCKDIDECELNIASCHARASCQNTDGSYICVCNMGYTGDGKISCNDTDECVDPNKVCDRNAQCTNNVGSFTCTCEHGYTGDGVANCIDIDECVSNPCSSQEKCINTMGSYSCSQCISGSQYVNGSCVDKNECEQSFSCPTESTCINIYGSYRCVCPVGKHVYNGMCIDVLSYNIVLQTNQTYAAQMNNQLSQAFGELAMILQKQLEDILRNTGLANDTIAVVLREVKDNDGKAEAHLEVVLNGNSARSMSNVSNVLNNGLANNNRFGSIMVSSPLLVSDKDECMITNPVCAADQTCYNHEGTFTCYCTKANHIVIDGQCQETRVFEVNLTVIEGVNYSKLLEDSNSVMFITLSDDLQNEIMNLVHGQQQSTASSPLKEIADNILSVRAYEYAQGSVIVHMLFYININSSMREENLFSFLNRTIPIQNDKRILGGKYVIEKFSVFDHDECKGPTANNLARVSCGFGNCVNVIGSYRCHCPGDVDPRNGSCLPRTTDPKVVPPTTEAQLAPVPVDAMEDNWWVVYAVVFGVLFVVIFMLMVALCCAELGGNPLGDRYSVHSHYEIDGRHAYHHDVRTDDEVAPGVPGKVQRGSEYVMGDEVIAYKTKDNKGGFYEINPIYDNNRGGTVKSYSAVSTVKEHGGPERLETESAYHSATNGEDSPSNSPPPDKSL